MLELLALELPLDLELAEVAEQRALLGREAIGFALQRLQPLGRAPRERLGPRALAGTCAPTAETGTAKTAKTAEKTVLCVLRELRESLVP